MSSTGRFVFTFQVQVRNKIAVFVASFKINSFGFAGLCTDARPPRPCWRFCWFSSLSFTHNNLKQWSWAEHWCWPSWWRRWWTLWSGFHNVLIIMQWKVNIVFITHPFCLVVRFGYSSFSSLFKQDLVIDQYLCSCCCLTSHFLVFFLLHLYSWCRCFLFSQVF